MMPANGIPAVKADRRKGNEKVERRGSEREDQDRVLIDKEKKKKVGLLGCGLVEGRGGQRTHLVRSDWPAGGRVVSIVLPQRR